MAFQASGTCCGSSKGLHLLGFSQCKPTLQRTTQTLHTLRTLTRASERQQNSFSWLEAESTAAIFTTFLTHTRSLFFPSHSACDLWRSSRVWPARVRFVALDSRAREGSEPFPTIQESLRYDRQNNDP